VLRGGKPGTEAASALKPGFARRDSRNLHPQRRAAALRPHWRSPAAPPPAHRHRCDSWCNRSRRGARYRDRRNERRLPQPGKARHPELWSERRSSPRKAPTRTPGESAFSYLTSPMRMTVMIALNGKAKPFSVQGLWPSSEACASRPGVCMYVTSSRAGRRSP
jgi:hypothetical protein